VDYDLKHRVIGNAHIGIEKTSRKKGHIYHTQVYDLAAKRLLWSGEDQTAETLEAFCDEFGKKYG
jgi:hypothetical protein